MVKNLSLKELYTELEKDPDLRRLGQYKIIPKEGGMVTPIDINFEGKDINLGEGDYTEAFTALADTKARSLDFGKCIFSDLYLDRLEVDTLLFSNSKASRLYFDSAKTKNCDFDHFDSPEIYFDESEIENILVQSLRSGVLYLGKLKATSVECDNALLRTLRFCLDPGGASSFGNIIINEINDEITELKNVASEQTIHLLNSKEFLTELEKDPDLRRLGKYRVIPEEGSGDLLIDIDLGDRDIDFGNGDFTMERVSFGQMAVKDIIFHDCTFSQLGLGNLTAEKIDFSASKAEVLHFDSARIGQCFFSDFYAYQMYGDQAGIEHFFGERGIIQDVILDSASVKLLNLNGMQVQDLRLGKSKIEEMFMSRGDGIKKVLCGEAEIRILNLHEARLDEIDFENSHIIKALINKCSIDVVRCDNLTAELLYIGNDGKNQLGLVDFSEGKGIERIEIGKILPRGGEIAEEERRHIFETLRFGRLH